MSMPLAVRRSSYRTDHVLVGLPYAPATIALRGWGVADTAMETLAHGAMTLDERLAFVPGADEMPGALPTSRMRLGVTPQSAPAPDLVIHLVDLVQLAGPRGEARWNTYGPIEAMRRAQDQGRLEIALCSGPIRWLPVDRSGCWILAGGHGFADALEILTRAVLLPLLARNGVEREGSASAWMGELAGVDLLGVLAAQTSLHADVLSAWVESFVLTAIRQGVVMPGAMMLAEPPGTALTFGEAAALFGRLIRLYRRGCNPPRALEPMHAAAPALRADLLLCFPWPRGGFGLPGR